MTPLVSIVVPIYNVEEYLEECLNSLREQTLKDLEVILVDDGSPDSSGVIAERFAKEDDRFKYFKKTNGGLGAARNYGTVRATGKYLAFVDSDDKVAPSVYEHLVSRIELDESDFAICAVARFNSKKTRMSALHSKAFYRTPSVTNIVESNQLIYDTTAWNKLIRRSFWDDNSLAFPEGMLYEDIPVTIPMHCLANKVSILQECGYFWRMREGSNVSITQDVANPNGRNLRDRLRAMEMVDTFFASNVQDASLIDAKNYKWLDTDLAIFMNACKMLDDGVSEHVINILADYMSEHMPKDCYRNATLINQQKYLHVVNRDLQGLRKAFAFENDYRNLEIVRTDSDLQVNLPAAYFSIEDNSIGREIQLQRPNIYISSASVKGKKAVIKGHVYKTRLSVSAGEQQVSACIVDDATARETPLDVVAVNSTKLTAKRSLKFDTYAEKEVYYDYDGAGFEITIDLRKLVEDNNLEEGSGHIIVSYSNCYDSGNAVLAGASAGTWKKIAGKAMRVDDSLLRFEKDAVGALVVTIEKGIAIAGAETSSDEVVLEMDDSDLTLLNENDVIPLVGEHGKYKLDPMMLKADVEYSLMQGKADYRPVYAQRREVKILKTTAASYVMQSSRDYRICIKKIDCYAEIVKRKAQGSRVEWTISCADVDWKQASAVSLVTYGYLEARNIPLCSGTVNDDGTVQFEFDLADSSICGNMYSGERQLLLEVRLADGSLTTIPVYSESYFKQSYVADTFKLALIRSAFGNVKINSVSKWLPDENTEEKRQKIARDDYDRYRRLPLEKKTILFESMWGEKYSCNPRAIYEYISQNYPDYECIWAFNDQRTPISGNARRVRRHSREYYKCLATAKYLVNNVNFPDAYVKRDGQSVLQTMHGTPLKTLGFDVASEVATESKRDALEKRCANWDYLLAQGEFMVDISASCYHYKKKFLKLGYPRTDKIFSRRTLDIVELKRSIGIPVDKKVILYAPTWRVRNRFDMQLELEKMRERLGDDYVVLVRLHYFVLPNGKVKVDNEFSFDVSDYQSVEDLCLISDLAILDYSSIMFDYALLGKQMIFYLYDLEDYRDNLRGLYVDIEEEAPGPIAFSTDEVIKLVISGERDEEKVKLFKDRYLTFETPESSKAVTEAFISPRPFSFKRLVRKFLRK